MLDKTSSIICAFGLASAAPRSPYRHLELCGIAQSPKCNFPLLGKRSPRTLVCQCCGMPLDDSTLSKGPDGAFNEDYCKWCYADGRFAYPTKASLLDYLMAHMPNPDNAPAAVCRAQFDTYLSQLKHWKEKE